MFGKKKIVLDDVVIGNVLKGAVAPCTRKSEEFEFIEKEDFVLFGLKNKGLKK